MFGFVDWEQSDPTVTTNLELGSMKDELDALLAPELKADVFIDLQFFKAYECSLDLLGDNL